jgi:hypothetical protein
MLALWKNESRNHELTALSLKAVHWTPAFAGETQNCPCLRPSEPADLRPGVADAVSGPPVARELLRMYPEHGASFWHGPNYQRALPGVFA